MRERFYPEAKQLILPEAWTQPLIVPRVAIGHSQAGTGSLFNYWLNGSNLESHMWFDREGGSEQYMPFDVRADANLNANSFAVSFETENSREAVQAKAWDTDPWTEPQKAAIVRFLNWLCDEWSIPRRQVDYAYGSGLGWHVMFGAPGPWTPVAKACPGAERIRQFRDEIIPAVVEAGLPESEFLMALSDEQQDKIAWQMAAVDARTSRLETAVKALAAAVEKLTRIAGSDLGWDKATAAQLGVPRDGAVAADPTNK